MIISSQRYLDDEIVAAKIESRDFVVMITPEFEVNGDIMQAIVDGHHSYAAAVECGATPEFVIVDAQHDDRIALLDQGNIDGYLESAYHDSDWYDIETGITVF